MKTGANWLILGIIALLPFSGKGQSCDYNNILSDFQKDQLCSPVEVIKWEVAYTDVDNAGFPVSILFDWDDGNSDTLVAVEGPAGTFTVITTHTYVSIDERCNYHAVATLVVNGVMCTSSPVEVVVTVWDVDNENGAYVDANPDIHPVCIGNGATMTFKDDTKFNCVPTQEEDKPNESTRWIQWVYGTNHADANFMSSSTPVSVNGYTGPWPYVYPPVPIEMPGPNWSSDEESLSISVANDNLLGEEFEVELRYWNFCNKYPDGKPPETDRAVIRIVDFPDATISPEDTLCEFAGSINLTAATGGGTWSGPGIVNPSTGEFSPNVAGPGAHLITYEITDGNNCTASDTETIVVIAGPQGIITPIDPLCIYSAPYDLEASEPTGTWGGPGITNPNTGLFNPSVANLGRHKVHFTTAPDGNGCLGTDTTEVVVVDVPSAVFLTPDSSWCEQFDNMSTAKILISGTDSSTFDLVININGTRDTTLMGLSNGIVELDLNNQIGLNEYRLIRVIEHHGLTTCEKALIDALVMQVNPIPEVNIMPDYDDLCSPVEVHFTSNEGYSKYAWDFGDGETNFNGTSQATHSYKFNYIDHVIGGDTVIIWDPGEEKSTRKIDEDTIRFTRHDTIYTFSLMVESVHGCRDTVRGDIPVYPSPRAGLFATPALSYYPDSLVLVYNLTSLGDWSYHWDFGDFTTSDLEEPVQHIYPTWGIYNIGLTAFNEHCSDTVVERIQIMPPPPVATFEPDTIGCPPLSVSFSNNSLYSDTYIWDFNDGTFSSEPNPTHTFFDSKDHTVRMTAIGLSGSDTTEHVISVYQPPQAIFNAYPREARNLKQNFKFTNNSVNGSYYLWDFGDGTTSPAVNPSHIYGDSGTYTVTLYAFSENNCVDTLVEQAFIHVVAGEGSIDFPTAFVWNGTGPSGGHWEEGSIDNSVFHPAVVNVREYRMVIYTRWGEQIFESNDLYIGWDGYLKSGVPATEGVYVWKAWVTYVDGVEDILIGDITFLH